jgi:hypothetical protein
MVLAHQNPAVRYVDAAAAVESNARYTDYLPCLAGKPCLDTDPATGQKADRVRAPDGVHFCPDDLPATAGVTAQCDRWSSGAWRYGGAMASRIIEDFNLA